MIARLAIALFLALSPAIAAAADPILRVEMAEDSAIPGQPVTLRLTVLVPTWLPKPPELPSYDLPNLMVRLQGRATNPTSERVEGETWSGITRRYTLYPLVPGTIEIPPQAVTIHFADPETSQPTSATLETPALSLTGTVPEAAAGLSPFIAANALVLEQEIEGEPADMAPGDAVTRRVSLAIEGAPAMLVPPLLAPDTAQRGLAAYPSTPVTGEQESADGLSGSRVEEVTYVAEGGGRFTLPALRLDWFNLETGEIETVEASALEIAVRGPPPAPETPPRSWRDRLRNLLPLFGVVLVVVLAGRRLARPVVAAYDRAMARWRASERHAFEAVIRAVGHRNLGETNAAIGHWWRHPRIAHRVDAASTAEVTTALAAIGQQRYGAATGGSERTSWHHLAQCLRRMRPDLLSRRPDQTDALPPLNPAPCAGQAQGTS